MSSYVIEYFIIYPTEGDTDGSTTLIDIEFERNDKRNTIKHTMVINNSCGDFFDENIKKSPFLPFYLRIDSITDDMKKILIPNYEDDLEEYTQHINGASIYYKQYILVVNAIILN
jgi:hypothetical protein